MEREAWSVQSHAGYGKLIRNHVEEIALKCANAASSREYAKGGVRLDLAGWGALRLLGRGQRQQTPIKLLENSNSHSHSPTHFASVSLLFSIFFPIFFHSVSGLLLTDII